MAFSSSIKRAQAIKHCELCEQDRIKWRCVDCDKCLCEKCKCAHLKIPVTAKHEIVSIATPLQYIQRKIILDNIPCKDHTKRTTVMFCRSCNHLVCSECISGIHENHKFVPIETALEDKMNRLKNSQEKIDSELGVCDLRIEEMENTKTQCDLKFDESVSKIKQREQEMKEDISKMSKTLQNQVEAERFKVQKTTSENKQHANEIRATLENQKDKITTVLSSNQGKLIFEATVHDLQVPSYPTKLKACQFFPGVETNKQLQQLFGTLQMTNLKVASVIDFQVLKTFTVDLSNIDQICAIDPSTAWVDNFYDDEIMRVNIQDNEIISHKISVCAYDIEVSYDNGIIFTTDAEVNRLNKSGEIEHVLDVAPLKTLGIHVAENRDMLVGVKESGEAFTLTDQSKRAVIVFDRYSKQKQCYEYNSLNGKRLFNFPCRITTNKNQDILILDGLSENTARVVCLERKGSLRWIYNGKSSEQSNSQFDPEGIVTTSAGYIILSDHENLWNATAVLC